MNPVSFPAKSPARELVDFVHALSLDAVPGTVTDSAKWCLLDSLGCALFGSAESWATIMADEMLAERSNGQASIVGHRQTVAAPAAALCNRTAAHGFELADHLDAAIVHPGAIIIPAAVAAAESVDAPGSRLLLGLIAGYATLNRVGPAVGVAPP